ncbi:MAG: DUF2807 domain-containing protein [Bacteroidetes bacterium]|nr:MAG: DUF2807 domain-containing protein [Bacteroidota bacterium]
MKTQNKGIIWLVLLLFIGLSSCEELGICEQGQGAVVQQSLQLPTFDGFDLKIAGKVYVRQSDTFSVVVEGQQNVIDLLDTDVDNGIWKIRFRQCVNQHDDLNLYISLPALNYVKVSGSGDVLGQSLFDASAFVDLKISGSGNIALDLATERFSGKITGSGNMQLNVEADEAESQLTGSGNFELQGSARHYEARISGSGDVHAFDFLAQDCEVRILGAGNAQVHATQTLDINIGGSGNVRYRGQPALTVSITGSGRVIDAN